MTNNAVELKPSKLYIIPLVFLIILIVVAIADPSNSTMWIIAGVLLVVTIFLYIASTKKLIISDKGITQETLTGKKELSWQEVSKIYLNYKKYGHGSKSSVQISLVFERSNQKEFKLLLDSYIGKKRQAIADAVVKNSKGIQIDNRLHQLANGNFKINYQEEAVFS